MLSRVLYAVLWEQLLQFGRYSSPYLYFSCLPQPVSSLPVSSKLAVHHHILPHRLIRGIRHSFIIALFIRTASSSDRCVLAADVCQKGAKASQTNAKFYTEVITPNIPVSLCTSFHPVAKKTVVEGKPPRHRAPKLAMPGSTASSKARVYTDVNTQKSREYWDYDAHVPSWRY